MPRGRLHCLPILICVCLLNPDPCGADWTQFRGPNGSGAAEDRGLPVTWGDDENMLWQTDLPGAGTSSPVIYGGRVYLTAHTGYGVDPNNPGDMEDLTRLLICIDSDNGEIMWTRVVESLLPETEFGGRILSHGYASSTPAVDADGVYCFFGKSGVFAFDHAGNQLWRASVGTNHHGWGSASSPVLYGDLVIVNAFVECGSLVALDRRTGEQVWRAGELKESWNTPQIVRAPNGRDELAVGIFGKVLGFDPGSGDALWSCTGPNWYIVGSMVSHDGTLFCIAGKGDEATVAVRAGGRGDVTGSHRLWRAEKGSNVSSAVYHDGHLYFAHESQAIVRCLNAKTGAVAYEQRIPSLGMIYASPVVADGRIYYVSRQGGTVVLDAKPEFELLAHNRIESDRSVFNASPAVSDGRLYLRSDRRLYCIGTR
jgi:outer membrane protein assembly factor BamB